MNSDFTNQDYIFMSQAIKLASKGQFTVRSNPLVGCVLVKNNEVIGKGWHQYAGGPHAEINAIKSSVSDVKDSTAYITLEPCNHVGKTDACCEALKTAGIKRVFIAMQDPNPLVSGRGINELKKSGIEVFTGLMAEKSADLNLGFIKRMNQGVPFVICKIGMSLDGKIAMNSGESKWITSDFSRTKVQEMRAASGTIVTGIGTILSDDPKMNIRDKKILEEGVTQPDLVIVDSTLRIPLDSQILVNHDPQQRTIFLACNESVEQIKVDALQDFGVIIKKLPIAKKGSGVCLESLLKFLGSKEINNIFVEAGSKLLGEFVSHSLCDQLNIFVAPKILGSKAKSAFSIALDSLNEAVELDVKDTKAVGNDWLITCGLKN